MKKLINGQYVEMTADEIAEIQESIARAEAEEKKRPLTADEVTRLLIKQQINTITVDDQTALRMRRYYPTFAELVGKTVTQGTKFRATGRGPVQNHPARVDDSGTLSARRGNGEPVHPH